MTSLGIREPKVQSELYRLIKNLFEKYKNVIEGVRFYDIEPGYRVGSREADLVLLSAEKKPLLVIECKRKVEVKGGFRTFEDFNPLSSKVIDQALWYAVKTGSPIFATTNGRYMAVFKTPQRGEAFRVETHRLMVKEIKLDEKSVDWFLHFVCQWHREIPVRIIEIDWFFIYKLREFVHFLSRQLKPVIKECIKNEDFSKKLEEFMKRIGRKIPTEHLAREAAYIFMNKLVFYKILERYYPTLQKLKPIPAPDGASYVEHLKRFFEKAIIVTKDFEPVFVTGIYDDVPLPNHEYTLEEVNSFIEDMDTYKLENIGSDVVGYIYEELIPSEERHALGQFYTPPPVAELIVKWAIRNPGDLLMDPAVGSGTFLVKAYKRLKEIKQTKQKKEKKQIHKEILAQIFSNDINPFPAHLTAINLAMRDVRYPTSKMNILWEDFFNLRIGTETFAPYTIKTPEGELQRKIILPLVDAVVANPPYTRWTDIPTKTKDAIKVVISKKMKKYGLVGGITKEVGIYVHFIMYAYEFLKEKGRLGMIISNSWLQSDYGINFVNFLLDHFKVRAVIDFNSRFFRIPLIATCILLLEKEKNTTRRDENKTIFVYVDREVGVEEILSVIKNPKQRKEGIHINVRKQGSLPQNEKWIKVMFKAEEIEKILFKSQLMSRIEEFFEPKYGNISGVSARGGTGGDRFFYLTKKDSEKWGLTKNYLHPLLPSPRYSKCFTFTKEDWEKLSDEDKICYVFTCHKPKSVLPPNVKEFIKWGEKTTLVRVKRGEKPKTPMDSLASQLREKDKKNFCGWYDLGNIKEARLYISRRAQYYHRAGYSHESMAFDDSMITLIPKEGIKFSNEEFKSMLAYLNSDFSHFFIEIYGRPTGGGTIELDDKSVAKLPILNIKKLPKKYIKNLCALSKTLEKKARELGRADTRENFEKLLPSLEEIDTSIAGSLKLKRRYVAELLTKLKALIERRVSRISAKPEAVMGEEEAEIKPPTREKKMPKKDEYTISLTKWITVQKGKK